MLYYNHHCLIYVSSYYCLRYHYDNRVIHASSYNRLLYYYHCRLIHVSSYYRLLYYHHSLSSYSFIVLLLFATLLSLSSYSCIILLTFAKLLPFLSYSFIVFYHLLNCHHSRFIHVTSYYPLQYYSHCRLGIDKTCLVVPIKGLAWDPHERSGASTCDGKQQRRPTTIACLPLSI